MTTPPLDSVPVFPAKRRAIIFASLVMLLLAVCLWTNGGHPRSNWVYPFTVGVGVLGGLYALRRGDRPFGVGDPDPKPVPQALGFAAVAFLVAVAVFYGFLALGTNLPFTWAPGLGISGMTAVNFYRHKRGYWYSSWPGVVVLFGILFTYFFLEWAGVIPRTHV